MIVRLIGCGAVGSVCAEKLYDNSDFALIVDDGRKDRYKDGFLINKKKYYFKTETKGNAKKADLVIVALKNFSLYGALDLIAPFVGDDTTIMSLLNGIDAERVLSEKFGKEKVIYSFITNLSSTYDGKETVCFTDGGKIIFGEQSGEVTDRILRIKELFDKSKQRYEIPTDIMHEKWWKFMLNTCFNTLSAILDADYAAITDNTDFIRAVRLVASEVVKVANAEGVRLCQEDIEKMISSVTSLKDHGKTSMLQDVQNKKETENMYFAGTVSRLAHKHSIPSPYLDMLYILLEARRNVIAKS